MMRLMRIALELFLEARHDLLSVCAKPTLMRVVVQNVRRTGRAQESSPSIQYLLELGVYPLVQKCGKSGCCSHRPIENRVDRTTDQTRLVKLRRESHDRIQ